MNNALKLRVMFDMIDNITKPLKNVLAGTKGLASSLKQTRHELGVMGKTQKSIADFRELRGGLAATAAQLGVARGRVAELAASLRASGQPSRRMIVNFEKARQTAARLSIEHERQSARVRELRTQLTGAGIDTRALARHERELRANIASTSAAIKEQVGRLEALSERERRIAGARNRMQAMRGVASDMTGAGTRMMVGGTAAGAAALAPIAAYARAEDSAAQLSAALMREGGVVSREFAKINALAVSLGNRLPGTTSDFQNMMTMLTRQGISAQAVLDGMGEAAAYLAVQLKKTPAEAAEFAAKLQDATRTRERDMLPLMDVIQKSFYLGVDDGNMLDAFSKLAPAMDTTKLKGLDGAKALAPLVVMADQSGLTGGAAGNALRKVFQLGMDKTKVAKANELLGAGMQLDFTDGRGEFGGLEKMFSQLNQLKTLTTQQRGSVTKAIFGDDAETLQAVSLLMEKGKAGYDEVLAKLNAQAALKERVDMQLGTLKNLWDASTGTLTNAFAALGESIAPEVKGVVQWIGDASERMGKWAKENPKLSNALMKTVAALALLLAGTGALAIALAGVLGPLAIVKFSMATLGIQGGLVTQAIKLGATAWHAFAKAAMFAGRAMLTNPIVLAITGLALAAFVLYRYWEPIKAFFCGLWDQVRTVFDDGLAGIGSLVVNWSPLGLFYRAFVGLLSWFGVELPAQFSTLGSNLVAGLVSGITGGLGAAKQAITSLAGSTVSWFKQKLGIHSPSRVFGELGSYISLGAADGMEREQGRVARAAVALATVATASFHTPAVAVDVPLATAVRPAATVPLVRPSVPIDRRPPLTAAPAAASAASASSPITINIYPAAGVDAAEIGRQVRAELERAERAKRSRIGSRLSD